MRSRADRLTLLKSSYRKTWNAEQIILLVPRSASFGMRLCDRMKRSCIIGRASPTTRLVSKGAIVFSTVTRSATFLLRAFRLSSQTLSRILFKRESALTSAEPFPTKLAGHSDNFSGIDTE